MPLLALHWPYLNEWDNTVNNKVVEYPYWRVVGCFACFGSLIGSLVIGSIAAIYVLKSSFGHTTFIDLFSGVAVVSLLGFIPALLSGMVLARKRVWRDDKFSQSIAFLTGFIVSGLCVAALYIYLSYPSGSIAQDFWSMLLIMILVGLYGGICASLTGLLVLPRVPKTRFDND